MDRDKNMNPNVKEISEADASVACQFCHRSEVNSLEWGPMYQLEGVAVHYFCLLFSSGLKQNGTDSEGILGFLPADVRKEFKRGDKLKCKFCKSPTATIGCCVKTCKMSYHYTCGVSKDCVFQFIGNYESYCGRHREIVNIPLPKNEWECPICFCEISDGEIPLWPPCCQKQVFHKTCIMEMANNHGAHFFKCPLCNDRDIFSEAMRRCGIFLPIRDATWETVPDAFAEQATLYSKCDAVNCACPRGREFFNKTESKPWVIVRCQACGASGIHKHCGNLQDMTWQCPTCEAVLSEKREDVATNSSNAQRLLQYDLSSDEEKETSVIGMKEIITDVPIVASSTNSSSGVVPQNTIYDTRYRRHLIKEDSSSEDSDASCGSVNYETWKKSRTKIFEQKLKRMVAKCYETSSSTVSTRNYDGHFTDTVSDTIRTAPTGGTAPLSFSPATRETFIKSDGRKNIEGQVTLEPEPDVVNEPQSNSELISMKSTKVPECTEREISIANEDADESEITCIALDNEDNRSDEITCETVSCSNNDEMLETSEEARESGQVSNIPIASEASSISEAFFCYSHGLSSSPNIGPCTKKKSFSSHIRHLLLSKPSCPIQIVDIRDDEEPTSSSSQGVSNATQSSHGGESSSQVHLVHHPPSSPTSSPDEKSINEMESTTPNKQPRN